ncbi:MAG TPA: TerC family protein [Chitinophagales bacterium]|nr:TerC family protein [Chitinophagales bacterium]HMU69170.1 TerC family protein [Chitinophagales bacterium]HMX04334.1 TerC family protein [Chitinophagales bacterium]HMZ88787.1 TerC family protein [Chitinophagales bacterium]HNA57271.1 TerC family protein [Chitinophagales bacterium]
MDLSIFMHADAWIALLTLTILEIVLGIDNIIFISILSTKLPEAQQKPARRWGLMLAMGTRVLLLLSISWILGLEADLFNISGHGISGRDIVLLIGGFFLIYKATTEIHGKIEGEEHETSSKAKTPSFVSVVGQILLLDIVFSLDSVITAVGMVDADKVIIMIAAVIIAVIIMLFAADPISNFVQKHPTVKMLALSFLVMIGVSLIIEGWGGHVEKGYIYTAMGFSVVVEMLNLRMKANAKKRHELRNMKENEFGN